MNTSKLTAAAVIMSLAGVEAATDLQACMYCKRADTNAGYMTSFSYCPDNQDQKCIKNFWEYIQPQMQCVSTTKDGWTIDIDGDCAASTAAVGICPTGYVGTTTTQGTTLPPKNVVLGVNTKCTIRVDANEALARVTFSGTNDLGVLYPSYVMGQPITVEKGKVQYITVYNGKQSGSVQFAVTFSGAASLALSGLAAAGLITLGM